MRKPTVALPVHYVTGFGTCRAATITEVVGELVNLEIHHAAEIKYRDKVAHDDKQGFNTWHYVCGN